MKQDALGQVLERIDLRRQIVSDRALVVGITGADASGKTLFADSLVHELLSCGKKVQVIHTDDFHLPRNVRYAGELPEHIKYYRQSFDTERLVESLLRPVHDGLDVRTNLPHLNVASDTYDLAGTYEIDQDTIVVLEGVFLLRRELCGFVDLMVFLDVPEEILIDRGASRDAQLLGSDAERRYREKYLPAQRVLNTPGRVDRLVDIVIDNSDPRARVVTRARPNGFAVIFDLWRTLAPLEAEHKAAALNGIAEALCDQTSIFFDAWNADRHLRETTNFEVYLRDLGRRLEHSWTDTQIARAKAARFSAHFRSFSNLREHTLEILKSLRQRGFVLGLISNCSSDVRFMLKAAGMESLFDVITLSAEVGLMKPDPQIFATTLRQLGSERGFYVGDGDDGELEGARQVGLQEILLDLNDGRTATISISDLNQLDGYFWRESK